MYMQYRTNLRQNTEAAVAGTPGMDHSELSACDCEEGLLAGDLAGLCHVQCTSLPKLKSTQPKFATTTVTLHSTVEPSN